MSDCVWPNYIERRGNVEFRTVDTTPGSGSVFSPPEGYDPPADDYRDMMRARWGKHNFRQDMMILARRLQATEHCAPLRVIGPYAVEAWEILRMVAAGGKSK